MTALESAAGAIVVGGILLGAAVAAVPVALGLAVYLRVDRMRRARVRHRPVREARWYVAAEDIRGGCVTCLDDAGCVREVRIDRPEVEA